MDARELDALIRAYRDRIDEVAARTDVVRSSIERSHTTQRESMERCLDHLRGALNRATALIEAARGGDELGRRQTRDRLDLILGEVEGELAELERRSRERAA